MVTNLDGRGEFGGSKEKTCEIVHRDIAHALHKGKRVIKLKRDSLVIQEVYDARTTLKTRIWVGNNKQFPKVHYARFLLWIKHHNGNHLSDITLFSIDNVLVVIYPYFLEFFYSSVVNEGLLSCWLQVHRQRCCPDLTGSSEGSVQVPS